MRDPVDTTPAKVTGTESPMEQGNGAFVRPVQSAPTGSKERKSRSKTRNLAKKTSDSPRSVSARSKLGMSFGVRFRVRTFGNKHSDGSNVRIYFGLVHNITCTFTCMIIECSLERTFIIKSFYALRCFR